MRLAATCFLLSAAIAGSALGAEDGTVQGVDLTALSEEEVEDLDDAVRTASEVQAENDAANEGEEEGDEAEEAAVEGAGWWPKRGGWKYCKKHTCGAGQGDCDNNHECKPGLVCGCDNCDPSKGFPAHADCCEKMKPFHRDYCKHHECGEGEGDCDCHAECGPGLKCGVNNCKKMHPKKHWIKWWADCCTRCSSVKVGPEGSRVPIPAEYWDANKEVVGSARTLVKPPPVLDGTAVWNLPPMDSTDSIKLKCCRFQHKKKCQFFISVYHCKPCSENHNGGLPGHLLSNGWSSGSCSPRFELPGDMSGTSHGMTTFHRTLYPGETEVIPLSKGAPHVAVFERTGYVMGEWCPPSKGPFPPGPGCTCIPALDGNGNGHPPAPSKRSASS